VASNQAEEMQKYFLCIFSLSTGLYVKLIGAFQGSRKYEKNYI